MQNNGQEVPCCALIITRDIEQNSRITWVIVLKQVFGNSMCEKFWNSGVLIKISRNKEKGKSVQTYLPSYTQKIYDEASVNVKSSTHPLFCSACRIILAFDWFLVMINWRTDALDDIIKFFFFFYNMKQVDSMLSCVCSGINPK